MSDQHSKIRRYLRAVRRRLPLPAAYRKRVMEDLESSIASRRESGQSDDEILTVLGAPAQAAADLCEGLQDKVLRKSPWRFLCLAAAIAAALVLLSGNLAELLLWPVNHNVGVIGGADGPTAIFISSTQSSMQTQRLIAVLVLIAGSVGYILLRRCRPKRQHDK